ncbi:MAG: hypothetical protein KDM81_17620, partial [Verrucomicrobiae bacterium]|nr:hypothetical protein [Verrucomicrobiae bacterium]
EPDVTFTQAIASQLRGRYSVEEPDHVQGIFPYAAEDWLLGRRRVLIVDRALSDTDPIPHYPAASLNDLSKNNLIGTGKDDEEKYQLLAKENYLVDGRREYIVDGSVGFGYDLDVVRRLDTVRRLSEGLPEAGPEFDAPVITTTQVQNPDPESMINWIRRPQLATAPTYTQSNRMGAYFLPNCASFKVEWALDTSEIDYSFLKGTTLPGASETIWIDPEHLVEQVAEMQPIFDDYYNDYCTSQPGWPVPKINECQDLVATIEQQVVGSIVPRNPDLAPSQFQINECYDFHSPGRFVDPGANGTDSPKLRRTHIFYPTKPQPLCERKYRYLDTVNPATGVKDGKAKGSFILAPETPDPLFPKALRITIDVNDAAGRLERPIRHVMVLPVGQE